MKPLTIFNDLHVAATRTGGVTPASTYKLRQDVLRDFSDLLAGCGTSVLLNGDVFDTGAVPLADLWSAVQTCTDWLGANPGCDMFAVRGNHDIKKDLTQMSSFDLFCEMVGAFHPQRFKAITSPSYLPEYDSYVIPHMPNQDIFNLALAEVPECAFLFLHCNYDNKFAVQQDHSLNLTVEQAKAAPVKHVILGHEHKARTELRGKVVVTGCQIVTSIADCLGETNKQYLEIAADGQLVRKECWQALGDFVQLDWRNLQDDGARFIRVIGQATAAEASEVVSAISKFRSKSDALVISNAVSVEGVSDQDELDLSVEQMAAFDVKAAIYEILSKDEAAVVSKLLEGENV